jgi:hypothetical protein
MYDQKSDFFDYTIVNKSELEKLPSEEVILIPDGDKWLYEHIDHNDWNLSDLELKEIPSKFCPMDYLKDKYPNAEIVVYENYADWEKDQELGCFK